MAAQASAAATSPEPVPVQEAWELLFGPTLTEDDVSRWFSQAIVLGDAPNSFGLRQVSAA